MLAVNRFSKIWSNLRIVRNQIFIFDSIGIEIAIVIKPALMPISTTPGHIGFFFWVKQLDHL